MKAGLQLQPFLAELDRQHAAKLDLGVPVEALRMQTLLPTVLELPQPDTRPGLQPGTHHILGYDVADPAERKAPPALVNLEVNGQGTYEVLPIAHRQIADYASIPWRYYDLLKDGAASLRSNGQALLDLNVNTILGARPGQKRLVRTLDGRARAFLSDRYVRIDNSDIAWEALQSVADMDIDWKASVLDVTDARMYLKLILPMRTAEVKVGDVVQGGVLITNSEVGLGAVTVAPLTYRLVCSNGAISMDFGGRKRHAGKSIADLWNGDDNDAIFQDDTLRALDETTKLQVRDLIRYSLSEEVFSKLINRQREALGIKIEGDPAKTVEVLQQKARLSDEERGRVLANLVKGGDLSYYGLIQAVTATAQVVPSQDRAVDLETLGGAMFDWPKADIRALTEERKN